MAVRRKNHSSCPLKVTQDDNRPDCVVQWCLLACLTQGDPDKLKPQEVLSPFSCFSKRRLILGLLGETSRPQSLSVSRLKHQDSKAGKRSGALSSFEEHNGESIKPVVGPGSAGAGSGLGILSQESQVGLDIQNPKAPEVRAGGRGGSQKSRCLD